MNYKFNILWFEDDPGWYRGAVRKAKSFTEIHSLECNSERIRSSEFDLLKLQDKKYDLILMDYDLKSVETGEKVIKKIRDIDIYTDILFYSSEYDSMIKSVDGMNPPIDGVYYANRKMEEFNNKLKRIIDKVVCRSEDLINLRGFVLDNTSDFELRIKEIIKICWDKFEDNQKDILLGKLDEVFNNKNKFLQAMISEAKKHDDIFGYANDHDHLLSTADRLDIMIVIIGILTNEYSMSPILAGSNFKDFYTHTIGKYRNRLGHVKMGDDRIKLDGRLIPIDQELHRLLRKNVIDCEKTITQLEKFVTENI